MPGRKGTPSYERTLKRQMFERAEQRAQRKLRFPLAPLQIKIIEYLISGYTIKEIILELAISAGTVNQQLRFARQRSGTRTRDQLVAWWAMTTLTSEVIAA